MLNHPTRIVLSLCLLLIAAISLAWLRSPKFTDSVEIIGLRGGLLISSHPGRVCVCWPSPVNHLPGSRWSVAVDSSVRDDDAIPFSNWIAYAPALTEAESARRPRFAVGSSTIANVLTHYVEVPYWIFLPFPALPVIWLMVCTISTRIRRRRLGLCRQCGYDLRASPTICPECGTPRMYVRPRARWPLRVVSLLFIALLVFGVWGCDRPTSAAHRPGP